MRTSSIIMIYLLFWVMSAFLILPFGIRAHSDGDSDAERVPGQADSAPVNFRPGRVMWRATIMSAILCAAFVANYRYGWITADSFAFLDPPTYTPASAG